MNYVMQPLGYSFLVFLTFMSFRVFLVHGVGHYDGCRVFSSSPKNFLERLNKCNKGNREHVFILYLVSTQMPSSPFCQ